ncbi:MAG TPA: LAGLIDADG family homing endonuclease [Chloroflexia bacterium]|nr:LAGLIDADG family homing endonuclease [Chloroflexia bacterium]
MAILSVDHPDIEEFIDMKNDLSVMTNFNVSVAVTEKFMAEVEQDADHALINPRTGQVVSTVPARRLFDKIVHNAWQTGEPGIVFIDRINNSRSNPTPALGQVESTNPCVTGDTRLHMHQGLMTMQALYESGQPITATVDTRVVNERRGTATRPAVPVFLTAQQADVSRVVTADGYEVRATAWHDFFTTRGKVKLRDLQVGDHLLVQSGEGQWGAAGDYSLGLLLGLIAGDGYITADRGACINLWGRDQALMPAVAEYVNTLVAGTAEGTRKEYVVQPVVVPERDLSTLRSVRLGRILAERYGFTAATKLAVPEVIWQGQRACVIGYLHGLFQTDGTVGVSESRETCSIRLASSTPVLLKEVQQLLANFGIFSSLKLRRPAGARPMPDGRGSRKVYAYQAQFELIIDGESRTRFMDAIGFPLPHKGERVRVWAEGKVLRKTQLFTTRVAAIIYEGQEPVYDTTQADRNTVIFNGLVTGQCGEQPLLPYEACNLGSVNVGRLTLERDGQLDLDWDALREVVHLATRALEDVIEMNKYPIPEIEAMTSRNRRIGVGLMGWADLLYKLRIGYNTEEAIALAEQMMRFIDDESKNASEQLAAERGPFAHWEESIYGPKGQHWPNAQGVRPLRNSTVTTIAPTGTISIIAGASGGIEPLFSLAFMRTVMDKDKLLEVNEIFEQVAREEGFYSPALMEEIAATGTLAHIPGVPDWVKRVFVTARDVTPEWHARMQAAFQQYTDNAVSKCLAAGTLIPTSEGLIPVESFSDIEIPDTFVSLEGREIMTGGHRILSHYYAGEKPATHIRLNNGTTLTGATESHRVLTPKGWRLMAELRVGDLVLGRFQESHTQGSKALPVAGVSKTNANKIRIPERMTPELAEFLGMIAADGHLTASTGAVGLSEKNEIVGERFTQLAAELFGQTPRRYVDLRNDVVTLTITSRRLCQWMQGLLGRGAYGKFVPEAILCGSAEEKLSFLRGISLDGFYVEKRGLTIYAGMSEDLACGVAALCQSFGLPLVHQHRKFVKESGQWAYGVEVSNELQTMINCIEPHKNGPVHFVAYQVLIDNELAEQTRLPANHPHYSGLRSIKQRRPETATSTLAARYGWDASIPVFKVTAVEDAGILPLYDIEVEDSHEYVVNGLVSHNTVNFPPEATEAEVREVYELAYRLGCKGVTIYRDGSRSEQPMSTVAKTAAAPAGAPATVPLEVPTMNGTPAPHGNGHLVPAIEAEVREAAQQPPVNVVEPSPVLPRPLPDGEIGGWMGRMPTPQGTIRLWVTEVDGQPREAYVILGKSGSDLMAMTEGIGRLLSIALRSGIPVEILIDQLRGIGGSRSVGFGQQRVLSVPDAIAKLLQQHYFPEQGAAPPASVPVAPPVAVRPVAATPARRVGASKPLGDLCPECGNTTLLHVEGCKKCPCGHSEC